jgi:hypothetical protein
VTEAALEIPDAHDPLVRLAIEIADMTEEGAIFRCTFESRAFRGSVGVSTYLAGPPSALFAEIAREWRGWKEPKVWRDRDHVLTLKATCPTGGYVTLDIEMRLDEPPTLITLASSLLLENSSLDRIASDAANLFREDRSLEFLSSVARRN